MENKESVNNFNTNLQSWKATEALLRLDDSFIGTQDYMGISYFWDCEYKFYLRDVSYRARQKVHKRLLELGLEVSGCSPEHEKVICKVLRISNR